MTKKQQPVSQDVIVERDGKRYTGSYTVERGVITVRYVGGRKATQVGNLPEEQAARMLLLELVAESQGSS